MDSFFWYDYETSGIDAARDRPMQFGGVRTDANLKIIGEPVCVYCQPTPEMLPQPHSCLVSGITPQIARAKGLPEAAFAARVHDELAAPGTCGCGYNNLRFDDEFTRHLLYRNLYPPYAREWQQGNSRWDLIDVMRMARALRPEGLEWPDTVRDDGETQPNFQLEALCRANGIEPGRHDALGDATATLLLAQKLRAAQPKLFAHALRMSDRLFVDKLLRVNGKHIESGEALAHSSGRINPKQCFTTLCLPLARHPKHARSVIACDLNRDVQALLQLDADELRELLFTPRSQLPEDAPQAPLKEIRSNRCPMLAPAAVIDEAAAQRLGIDLSLCEQRRQQLLAAQPELAAKLAEIYDRPPDLAKSDDVDLMLYSGGFFSDADYAAMERLRETPPEELHRAAETFQDPRADELLFRYRARNAPHTLDADESRRWNDYCYRRITEPDGGGSISLERYLEDLEKLELLLDDPQAKYGERERGILNQLQAYADELLSE